MHMIFNAFLFASSWVWAALALLRISARFLLETLKQDFLICVPIPLTLIPARHRKMLECCDLYVRCTSIHRSNTWDYKIFWVKTACCHHQYPATNSSMNLLGDSSGRRHSRKRAHRSFLISLSTLLHIASQRVLCLHSVIVCLLCRRTMDLMRLHERTLRVFDPV